MGKGSKKEINPLLIALILVLGFLVGSMFSIRYENSVKKDETGFLENIQKVGSKLSKYSPLGQGTHESGIGSGFLTISLAITIIFSFIASVLWLPNMFYGPIFYIIGFTLSSAFIKLQNVIFSSF